MSTFEIEAEYLKHLISDIEDDSTLEIQDNHMSISFIDAAAILAIYNKLNKSAFYKYEVGEVNKVNLDFKTLNSVLNKKRMGKEEIITMNISKEQVEFKTKNFKFVLPTLVEVRSSQLTIPTHNSDQYIEVRLYNKELKESIKTISSFYDVLRVYIEDNTFKISGYKTKSSLISNMEVELCEIITDKKVNSYYSLEYIENAMKSIDKHTLVSLYIGNNMPLFIEYEVDTEFFSSRVLAPRIEDREEEEDTSSEQDQQDNNTKEDTTKTSNNNK